MMQLEMLMELKSLIRYLLLLYLMNLRILWIQR